MGVSLIFSKKKIFLSECFTKLREEFRLQKGRIKFIKNLYTTKYGISFIAVLRR